MLFTLEQHAQFTPTSIAIETTHETLTYAALWSLVKECSAWLASQKPNAVGLGLPDGISWVVAHFACLYANIPQLPLPAFFTEEQRLHALADAGADLLLDEMEDKKGVSWRCDTTEIVGHVLSNAVVSLPEDTALITYTSGSTGTAKGVCLSLDGMITVAESLVSVLGKHMAARHLSIFPMAVLLEQIGGLYATFLTGGTYIFANVQKNPIMLAHSLAETRATSGILVPELLKLLLHSSEQSSVRFPELKFLAVGGARVSNDLLDRAAALQLPVYQGYGLTESASVVSVNTPHSHCDGTVGKPLPHIKYHLAQDSEIILERPAMLGYTGGERWKGPYATGDLGSVDASGFLTIQGRKKNVLITAYGRNVSPEWPESLLAAQSVIAQVMVYGDAEVALSALIVPVSQAVDQPMIEAAVAAVNAVLPDYARIGSWRLCQPFTVANGMLTGTGRIRREAILKSLDEQKGADHELFRPAFA